MQFAYEGFTQNANERRYAFHGVEKSEPGDAYVIRIDLPLFARHQVSIQNGPMFCLRLLQDALTSGPEQLQGFHEYRVVDSDFAGIKADRAEKAAALASKKPARRHFRKPSPNSQLTAGVRTVVPEARFLPRDTKKP
jgi:hypothetical protein